MSDDFCTFGSKRLAMPTGVGNTEDMDTTTKTTFWTDFNGRTCCQNHMGCYADAILKQNPKTRIIETDMTIWQRMTKTEIIEWAEFLLTECGETELCETCRRETKNK